MQNWRKRVVAHANRLKRYHCEKEDEQSQEDWVILLSMVEQVDETVSLLQDIYYVGLMKSTECALLVTQRSVQGGCSLK